MNQEQEDASKKASNGASDAPKKGTILLLDDDKFLLDMYITKFTAAGYAVEACLSGNAALTTLRSGLKPTVVLFDITMPELDGLSFLRTISSENLAPGALKIALSNQDNEIEKQEAIKLGTARYIVKARMIPSEVVSAVEEELARSRS